MNKHLIGKVIALALLFIMLGTFIYQQIEKSQQIKTINYEVDLTQSEGVGQGELAPDFTLQTLDGKTVNLADYKGKKIVVNFWATWCEPCRAEMPQMQKYYEKQARKDNVEILAINLTFDDKGPENVQKFINSYDITFPIPLLEDDKLMKQYEVLTIPSSFFIDSDGHVQKHIAGALNQEQLIHYTNQLN